jgi:hypothetical protein
MHGSVRPFVSEKGAAASLFKYTAADGLVAFAKTRAKTIC